MLEAGANFTTEILSCRTWGHAWDQYFPDGMERPAYGWRESLRCTRCTTERHRLIGRTGAIESVRYIYCQGYLAGSGIGRLERADLRSEMFERIRSRLVLAEQIAADYDTARRRRANVVTPITDRANRRPDAPERKDSARHQSAS